MILTVNDGKLIVNIPVSKNGDNWFDKERSIALNKKSRTYFEKKTYYTYTSSKFSSLPGLEFDDTRKFNFDSQEPVAYFCEYSRLGLELKIGIYSLLRPFVSKFLIYSIDKLESIQLKDMILKDDKILDEQSHKNLFSKRYDEINFILTCKDAQIKKELLYDRRRNFANMYYDIMPNIELKAISQYPISNLENNEDNRNKVYTARENNRVLQLLRK